MNFRSVLAVLTILAGVSYADAGVIVGQTADNTVFSGSASLSVLSDWMASGNADDTTRSLVNGDSTGSLAGVALTSVLTIGGHALLSSELLLPVAPSPLWRVELANTSLPPSPLSDGLLKPA